MSTKISLILFVVLTLFVTACSSTVASDPARVSSTNQKNIAIIPVTGENISETSNNEALSANDASDVSLDDKQVQISGCVLDGDLPRRIGGCVDFYSPNLNVDKNIPDDPCTSEVGLPHHRNGCD